MRCRSGRITAAATTGPASDPRPTSSMPAIRRYPARRSSRSWRMWASRARCRGFERVPGEREVATGSDLRSALAERCGLANAVAEEGELCSPGDAMADDLDLVDPRCVDHERALDADAARNASHGDRPIEAPAAHPHDRPLEDLNPLAASLHHLHRHAHGVACRDLRQVGSELLALELLDGVHPCGTSLSGRCWSLTARAMRQTNATARGGRDRRSIPA